MGICPCKCSLKNEKLEEKQEKEDKLEISEPFIKISNEGVPMYGGENYQNSSQDSSAYSKFVSMLSLDNNELIIRGNLETFNKNYELVKKIGRGNFGEVWLVVNKLLNKKCALKILRKEIIFDSIILKEINILKSLDHPNIVKIYDIYSSSRAIYIITEYCPEGNLMEEIKKRKKPFSEAECSFIMIQILMTMRYYHKMRIIHRDIKLENIMISKREDNGFLQVKLIDFGTAVFNTGEKKKLIIGTKEYISPDMINMDYDEKTDIWSLGIVMYFLLTYTFPFKENSDTNIFFKEVKTGKYNKALDAYQNLSIEAKDLIEKFLTLIPEKRISVKSALAHNWFKTVEKEEMKNINKIEPIIARKLIENIINYKKDNILKCSAIAFLVHNNTNLEPLIHANKLFKKIDSNLDGKITLEELKAGLEKFWGLIDSESDNKSKEIFNILDNDHNGYIEYEEFIRAVVDSKIFLNSYYLLFAFNYLDKDESGDISFEEIKCKFLKNFEDSDKIIEMQLKNILKNINVNENEPITFEIFSQIMENILN